MRNTTYFLFLLVLGSAFAKANSPDPCLAQNDRTVDLRPFDTVKVFDLITVNLVKSDTPKIVIKGRDADEVVFIEKEGTLKIRMETDMIFHGEDTFVYVYYTDLNVIDGNEGAQILTNELMDQTDLEIRVQEGARVEAGLKVKNLELRAVTGGILELQGTSQYQHLTVNTGGIAENESLKSDHVKVKVQAGGEVEVYASKSVDISVRAGGDVTVYGNPSKRKKNRFLGGRIDFVD